MDDPMQTSRLADLQTRVILLSDEELSALKTVLDKMKDQMPGEIQIVASELHRRENNRAVAR